MIKYIELNMANYDDDQVAQLNAWGIWASQEIERLQAERAELTSRKCTLDEVDVLMDCIHADGKFEDLDIHAPEEMQTTTGSTIAWIMHRCHNAETALKLSQAKQIVWKSVKKEMPDDDIDVLIQTASPSFPVWIGSHDADTGWRWCDGDVVAYDVTHWAEIPEGASK